MVNYLEDEDWAYSIDADDVVCYGNCEECGEHNCHEDKEEVI